MAFIVICQSPGLNGGWEEMLPDKGVEIISRNTFWEWFCIWGEKSPVVPRLRHFGLEYLSA